MQVRHQRIEWIKSNGIKSIETNVIYAIVLKELGEYIR
jgi:hypothetical protein